MKLRQVLSNGHNEIRAKECPPGAASEGNTPVLFLSQNPREVDQKELQHPQMEVREET
jgi:hypothetical protein